MAIFVLLILFILMGIPVAFSFGLSGILYLVCIAGESADMLPQAAFGSIDSFAILSLPFFMFAGDIMKYGGVSKRLVSFAKLFFGKSKSALGNITVLACAFFGAISGSSAATIAAIGGIMVPEMEKEGYKNEYATALAAASGYLGILIPPSVPLVIYGIAANQSIGRLFMAGIGPGILAAAAFMVLNKCLISRNFVEMPEKQLEKKEEKHIGKAIIEVIPGLLMPVIILGGIYGGIFTATEAAAVAIFYGLFVSLFVYKEIKLTDIPRIAKESALTSAKILLIMSLAGFFGRIMSLTGLPQMIANAILSVTSNKILLTILINVILLILGMLMETGTAIILVTPILLPIATSIGIDPIHFGTMMIFNLAVGLITPPMALNLFVASQVGNLPVAKIIRPVLPFLAVSLGLLIIVTFVPQVSVLLPNLLY